MSEAVLVTHPGRQHSHRAALALEGAGRLAGYWAGVPSREGQRGWVPRGVWRRFVRYAAVDLPEGKCRAATWVPGVRQVGNRLPRGVGAQVDLWACRAFDRWVAKRIDEAEAGAVLACEISALTTFRAAGLRGLVTLLDAPSIHHRAQDSWHGYSEPEAVHRRVVAVKEGEIAAADGIVTVSELARETYLEAGVAAEKVVAVSLGADLELFASAPPVERTGRLRLAFAGAPIPRKGFDLLIEALERLVADGLDFHLKMIGPRGELSELTMRLPWNAASSSGPLPQWAMPNELAPIDLLVLPSRNDSYGMVVAEALAAGIPVLVSERVGAKELVREGVNGWVVPSEDVAALAARLAECARAPQALRACTAACRESVRSASWEAYEERFLAAIEPFFRAVPGRQGKMSR